MALKIWEQLPLSIRRSRKNLYKYLYSELTGIEDDDTGLQSRVAYLEGLLSTDVSFTVKDDQGTPAAVEGAVVTVAEGKTGTTGAAGGCTVKSVLYGEYTVTVVADGFEDYSDTITVDASHTSFNISLTTASSGES